MPDTLVQPLQRWHDFYLLVGGASATLVGLMFLAISLGSRLITEQSLPALRVFVSPTIIHFIYVLVIATVAVIPTLTRVPLGILLVLAGLVSFGHVLWGMAFMRRRQLQRQLEYAIDRSDWIWYLIVPAANYVMLVGTGVGLLLGIGQALNALALVSILLLVNGVRNAWDLVVWFAVKVEAPPR